MSVEKVIEQFEGISLSEMDSVKLMNRTDRKFWFNINHLEDLLRNIKDEYYALEIEGERNLPYLTTYYDTYDDQMYLTHHRGKLNRFKIRRRNYLITQSSFLEIKFKNNKGRTIKQRIPTIYENPSFNVNEEHFIAQKSPYETSKLHKVLINRFRRLMLVSKAMNERCTIDQELTFVSNGTQVSLEQLVVVEVKSEGRASSPIIRALNRKRLKASGFSKYCIGRSLTNVHLKSNRFRLKHRQIEKRIAQHINREMLISN